MSIDSTSISAILPINSVGNSTICGNLSVNGFIAAKPYAALRVGPPGGTPSTGTSAGNIGTPGTASFDSIWFFNNVSVARGTAAATIFFIFVYFTNRSPFGVKIYC